MDRPDAGFEPFDHTADLGLHVWAPGMEALFEQAAAGLASLMVDPANVTPTEERPVTVHGGEPEELLVAWLEEVLFALEVDGFATVSARVTTVGEGTAEGILLGEPFDATRHSRGHVVKAVTYHGLAIERRAEGCVVDVVFDV